MGKAFFVLNFEMCTKIWTFKDSAAYTPPHPFLLGETSCSRCLTPPAMGTDGFQKCFAPVSVANGTKLQSPVRSRDFTSLCPTYAPGTVASTEFSAEKHHVLHRTPPGAVLHRISDWFLGYSDITTEQSWVQKGLCQVGPWFSGPGRGTFSSISISNFFVLWVEFVKLITVILNIKF